MSSSPPLTTQKSRACVGCHLAKCKCSYSAVNQSTCDRCLRLHKTCVPHVSRQGKRVTKADKAAKAAANHSAACASVGATSDAEGVSGGSSRDPFTAVTDNSRAGTNLNAPNCSIKSDDGYPNPRTHAAFVVNQGGAASLNYDVAMGIACEVDTTPPTSIIPLRQWIQGAYDSSGTSNCVPRYIESCLQIASSLAEQITNAEEGSSMRLGLLPHDLANWAELVVVKVDQSGSIGNDGNERALATSSSLNLESERLEALLDSVGEEIKIDTPDCRNSVVSAEILLNDFDQGGANCYLSPHILQQIYALGLVFYELFSGGKLSPLEVMQFNSSRHVAAPNAETMDDSLEKLVNSQTVSLADTLTLHNDKEADIAISIGIDNRRKKPLNSHVSSNSWFESLKLIGLPSPLCELLCNMLDCVNGDSRGHESYSKMSDVAYDLKLMKDKPSTFLHELDVVNLSSSGLQMGDHLFMREEELASLKNAYERSAAGSSEFAIISGSSGTGKSHLALHLGCHISNDGIFLCVKFNQLQMANPFSALVSAFNDYCTMFTPIKDSDWVKTMAAKLRDALGRDVYHLVKLVPSLSNILDCDTSEGAHNEDCVNGQRKIHYILTRFVEVISACSKATVTLFLDDLQWADEFSLSALEQIMVMPNRGKGLFVVGCYRDDEVTEDHPFKKVVGKASDNGVRLTEIQLECMDKDTVNRIVSDLLCLSRRLVKSLSEILYCKTKGNPLFFSRLLMSLNRDGLLNLSLSRRRWVWDEELIQSRQLPDDVASFLLSGISKLSVEVQGALQVLSCFGSIEEKESSILERDLGLDLMLPLQEAVTEGFVCKNKVKYNFAHDRIQETVYCSMPLNNRCHDHMKYGTCLIRSSVEQGGDDLLFTALGQINLAGPSLVADSNQSTEFARCHLIAGRKAVELSDFSSASKFVKSGKTPSLSDKLLCNKSAVKFNSIPAFSRTEHTITPLSI
eukprot:CCRYP_003206-RA/>CCRYP_003206-RA protein AED:0.03 eAED:0.03 QI:45/1/1/1/1/0.8/5/1940/965